MDIEETLRIPALAGLPTVAGLRAGIGVPVAAVPELLRVSQKMLAQDAQHRKQAQV